MGGYLQSLITERFNEFYSCNLRKFGEFVNEYILREYPKWCRTVCGQTSLVQYDHLWFDNLPLK